MTFEVLPFGLSGTADINMSMQRELNNVCAIKGQQTWALEGRLQSAVNEAR